MKSPILLVALTVGLLFTTVFAKSATGNRVLVLLDDLDDRDLYSRFWQSLENRDYELSFQTEKDDGPGLLQRYGEYLYDHIIHFAAKSKDIGKTKSFSNVDLVKFVNDGGNLLVASAANPSQTHHDLAAEFNIEFSDSIDLTKASTVSSQIIGWDGKLKVPVVYEGATLLLGKSPMLNRILSQGKDDLVAAMQARNSARVTFSGSLELFSDSSYEKKIEQTRPNGTAKRQVPSSNEAFVNEVVKWTFQEKNVLKIVSHRHHKAGEDTQPDSYRIKDEMVYLLEVSEYQDDTWVPYKADDIQLEIIMLDPYIRTTLKQVPVSPEHHYGLFVGHVRLPDVYGVFTFKVNYKRPGLTYLLAEDVVALKPFRHNEYPRFLSAAYPYYASVGSMIVGFLVFSAVWLSTWGSKDNGKQKQKTH
ncbi:Dolichyl-diphosphooligosaccharide--protein glycosyltransferase subunit WBP1 [Dichotomocladium elegans]|nr:Dolichyl-diphosphooligosaccharide--protein glycosyltransferase subunit WBP1 [Dichotomocladium elegans]